MKNSIQYFLTFHLEKRNLKLKIKEKEDYSVYLIHSSLKNLVNFELILCLLGKLCNLIQV